MASDQATVASMLGDTSFVVITTLDVLDSKVDLLNFAGQCKRRPLLVGIGAVASSLLPSASLLAEGARANIYIIYRETLTLKHSIEIM